MTPRILFWCGRAIEPWGPPSLDEGGIGGSETAVIHVARRLSKAGWRVDVASACDYYEGIYDGVAYFDPKRLRSDAEYDVIVGWRDPNSHALPIKARKRFVWLHDYLYGPQAGPSLARFDRVLGVSQWHADLLAQAYELTNTDYVPNGIELERFDLSNVKKVPFQCVWSSSPDRDLDLMLSLWPRITQIEPEATLHVAYGWQGIDFRIAQGDENAANFKARLQQKMDATKGVTWHGRMGQNDVAKLKMESWASPYLTSFAEVSCISMMESMAAGCVPVCSATGALKETVGDGGYVIPGQPSSGQTQEFWLRIMFSVLGEANARIAKIRPGLDRARELTWDKSVDRWLSIINGALEAS